MLRIYRINPRNQPAAIALAALALSLGAVLLAFGIVLLLAVTAVGTVVASGVLLYRAVTGRRADGLRARDDTFDLDPSLEIEPSTRTLSAVEADKPTS